MVKTDPYEDAKDESTPIMQPVRMELAPHVRLGRRVSAMFSMAILMLFHTALILAGLLNWDVPCEYSLSRFLVAYGCCGLLFVYLLLREWMFYARLASWPSSTAFALMAIFYVANMAAGILLAVYTIRARDTCRITAPLLYRWCFAAALFTALLLFLCLLVPVVRCFARCVCAPVALCLISCVETVGMDVDVGVVGGGAMGFVDAAGEGASAGRDRARSVQQQFIPAAAMVITGVVCAPFFVLYKFLCAPICRPFSICAYKFFELCGCVSILPDGRLEFTNCCGEQSCGFIVRHMTQCLLAPGMTTPGRSIVGAFTNYSALVWFWCYLLFELYWNWNLMCEAAVPDSSADLTSARSWFAVLSPSPVHWLILLFAVSGLIVTLGKFVADMFTYPTPPPRSAYEVHVIKMRRQLRVCLNLLLFAVFCVWGGFLFYFTESQSECASSSPSIWRLALLLRLVFIVIVVGAFGLFTCVCIECCMSGRMRLVMLLSDDPAYGSSYTGDAAAGASGAPVAGAPAGRSQCSSRAPEPHTQMPLYSPGAPQQAGSKFYVGATDDRRSRLVQEAPELGAPTTQFTNADPNGYSARLLPEQAV